MIDLASANATWEWPFFDLDIHGRDLGLSVDELRVLRVPSASHMTFYQACMLFVPSRSSCCTHSYLIPLGLLVVVGGDNSSPSFLPQYERSNLPHFMMDWLPCDRQPPTTGPMIVTWLFGIYFACLVSLSSWRMFQPRMQHIYVHPLPHSHSFIYV